MTYTLMSVPEDKEVWCTGFRFDDTKAGINCKPVQGSIHNKDYWNSKFKTKNRTISENTNLSFNAIAATYEAAAHIYNEKRNTFLVELDNRYHKIASSLEGCYLSNDRGVMF